MYVFDEYLELIRWLTLIDKQMLGWFVRIFELILNARKGENICFNIDVSHLSIGMKKYAFSWDETYEYPDKYSKIKL